MDIAFLPRTMTGVGKFSGLGDASLAEDDAVSKVTSDDRQDRRARDGLRA